jgi:hypothetical protein
MAICIAEANTSIVGVSTESIGLNPWWAGLESVGVGDVQSCRFGNGFASEVAAEVKEALGHRIGTVSLDPTIELQLPSSDGFPGAEWLDGS